MRKSFAPLFVLLVLASSSIPALSITTTGKVVTPKGKPIPNAKVVVTASSGNIPTTQVLTSDKDGQFTFEAEECATVQAVAEGYSVGESCWKPNEALQVFLKPELKLTGRVVDEKGQPISGVAIVLESLMAGPMSQIQYHAARSGDSKIVDPISAEVNTVSAKDGTFTLHHLPEARFHTNMESSSATVRFSKARRASVLRAIHEWKSNQSYDFTLPEGCTIQGTVYLPDKAGYAPIGTPIAAQVYKRPREMMMNEFVDKQYITNVEAKGKFSFTQLPAGKYSIVMASHSQNQGQTSMGYVLPALIGIEATPKKPNNLELVETIGAMVKGKVINSSAGKPFLRASLIIVDASRPLKSTYAYAECNDKGEFSFPVAPGEVTIGVISCQIGDDNYAKYETEDMPTSTFTIAERQNKDDLVISVDTTTRDLRFDRRASKQIPPDFELTPGTYKLEWDTKLKGDGEYHVCKYEDEKAAALIKKMPELVSSKPKVVAFQIDSSDDKDLLLAVLDEPDGTGAHYAKAYIDINRNSDLSDDQPVQLITRTNYANFMTWTQVQSHQGMPGSAQTHNPVSVSLFSSSGTALYKRGCWKGTVDSNKGKILFATFDSTMNGVYNDKTRSSDGNINLGDYVFADTNGAGAFVSGRNTKQAILINEINKIAGKWYKIKVSSTGDSVTIERYTGPMGKLRIKGEDIGGMAIYSSGFSVSGQTGQFTTEDMKSELIVVPVGAYKVDCYAMRLISKSGKQPYIHGRLDKEVEVKPEEETVVVIGGKITGAISPNHKEITMKAGQPNTLFWLPTIGGTFTIYSFSNEGTKDQLKVEFFDSDNNLVFTTSGEYIPNGVGEFLVQAPNVISGTYTMKFSFDTKCELGVISAERKVNIQAELTE